VKEQYQVKVSIRFAPFEILDDDTERERIQKLQLQSLGYYVLKQCKSCFHEVPKIVRS